MTEAPNVNELLKKGYTRKGDTLVSPTKTYPAYSGRDRKEVKKYSQHVVYLDNQNRVVKEEYFRPYTTYQGKTTEYMKLGVSSRTTYDNQGFKTQYQEYELYQKSKSEEGLKLRLQQNYSNDYKKGERTVQTQSQEVDDVVDPYAKKKAPTEKKTNIQTFKVGERNYAILGKGSEEFIRKKQSQAQPSTTKTSSSKQTVYIGLEKGGAEKINKTFREAGIGTAKEFFIASKEGKLTKEGDQFMIKSEQTTKTDSKNYLGWTDSLISQSKDFYAEASGKKEMKALTPLGEAIGKTKVGRLLARVGAGAGGVTSTVLATGSSIAEPVAYSFTVSRPKVSDIDYSSFEEGKEAQKKYDEQLREGQLMAGMLGAGLTEIKPGRFKVGAREFEKVSKEFNKNVAKEPVEWNIKAREKTAFQPVDESLGLAKSELQTQLKPREVDPLTLRFKNVEPMDQSLFAPEKYIPEYHLKLAREKYQTIFSEGPKLVKTEAQIRKESLAEFKKSQPSFERQTTLVIEEPKAFEIEPAVVEYKGKKIIILGKKGQASLTTELNNVYDFNKFTYKGDKFKPDLPDFVSVDKGTKIVPISFQIRGYEPGSKEQPINKIEIKSINFSQIKSTSLPSSRSGLTSFPDLELNEKPVYKYTPIDIQQPKFTTETITSTEQITGQRTPIFSRLKTRTTPPVEVVEKEVPRPRITGLPFPKTKTFSAQPRFDVLLRRQGTFKKINYGSLTRKEALAFGGFTARTTAGASFKIIPSDSNIQGSFKGKGNLSQFYKSSREKGVFIEKPKFRIDTPGEKTEITLKGIFTSKSKRKKKKRKGIFGVSL